MSSSDETFQELITRAMSGSDDAARILFERYEKHILRVIRNRLHEKMRSKFDSLDFAQDVWASFFAEPVERRSFESPAALMAFLTRIARHKIIEAVRQRMGTQQHDVNRECSLDDPREIEKNRLPGNEATPSQIVSCEEEWGEFLRRQPLVYRRIFILLREGKTTAEIAQEMGINGRLVRRVAMRYPQGAQ